VDDRQLKYFPKNKFGVSWTFLFLSIFLLFHWFLPSSSLCLVGVHFPFFS
jgi:hypothetical protein